METKTARIPLAGPAMKAAGVFAAGIIAGSCAPQCIVPALVLSVLSAVFLWFFRRRGTPADAAAAFLLFFTGVFSFQVQRGMSGPVSIPPDTVGRMVLTGGTAAGEARYAYGNTYFTLETRCILTAADTLAARGMLPCVVYGRTVPVHEGTHIAVRGEIKRRRRPLSGRKLNGLRPLSGTRSAYRLVVDENAGGRVFFESGGSFFASLRSGLSSRLDDYDFGGYTSLLKTMTIGEKSGLPPEIRSRFAGAGIAHVLAVSGLHAGIIAVSLLSVLKLLPIRKKHRIPIVVAFMAAYAGICGFRPPVVRAVVMLSMVLYAGVLGRRKNPENSLFAALIAVLAFDPSSIFSPSLHLSFAAVWGIVTFYPPAYESVAGGRRIPKWMKHLLGLLVVSAIASVVTAPITGAHFGEIHLYGILGNLAAVPLTFCIVNLGAAAVLLAALGPAVSSLTAVVSSVTGLLLRFLVLVGGFVSGLPRATIPTSDLSVLAAAFMAWLYILSRSRGRDALKKAAFYIPLATLLLITWHPIVGGGIGGGEKGVVMFFDVGQGDAALVSYGGKRNFLVDTGPRRGDYDAGRSLIAPSLKNAGITRLDGIFLSHVHSDHAGGIRSILESIPTERIFCRRSIADSLRRLFGTEVVGLGAGDSLAFGEGGIAVLSPAPGIEKSRFGVFPGENDLSLVIRFDMGGVRVLFTGDVEGEVQGLLSGWDGSLRSDVLKVPHHGAGGIDGRFVSMVDPEISVISCGIDNRYGHPAESTVSLLRASGSSTWRTDRDGTIIVSIPSLRVFPY